MGTGGFRRGAGRPGWRAKCEHVRGLDIRKLASLAVGTTGSYYWICDGESAGSVGYAVSATCVTLMYTWTPSSGLPVDVRFEVPLERTPCHFGGSRPWFRCPACKRRCAIIYGLTCDGAPSLAGSA